MYDYNLEKLNDGLFMGIYSKQVNGKDAWAVCVTVKEV